MPSSHFQKSETSLFHQDPLEHACILSIIFLLQKLQIQLLSITSKPNTSYQHLQVLSSLTPLVLILFGVFLYDLLFSFEKLGSPVAHQRMLPNPLETF